MESTKGQLIDDVAVILYGSFGEHLEDGRVTEEEIIFHHQSHQARGKQVNFFFLSKYKFYFFLYSLTC